MCGQQTEFDLANFLPYKLALAADLVSKAFAERYSRKFGLSIPEWRVLANLFQEGALSVRDIHIRAGMEKSKVSRAVLRLEQTGYVGKSTCQSDRRLVSLKLTKKGRKLMAKLVPLAMSFQNQLQALLAEDSDGLHRALNSIAASTNDLRGTP